MIRYFYGVYFKNSEFSTILDLVRFLGEPDAIRFSHVTLRGPYNKKLRKKRLNEINRTSGVIWKIRIREPDTFFSEDQNTVFLRVDLGSLEKLLRKLDFPNSVPHITLYDGRDRDFARQLFNILADYDWNHDIAVTEIKEIRRGFRVDEWFLASFAHLWRTYNEIIGSPWGMLKMTVAPSDIRMELIKRAIGTLPSLVRRVTYREDYVLANR